MTKDPLDWSLEELVRELWGNNNPDPKCLNAIRIRIEIALRSGPLNASKFFFDMARIGESLNRRRN